MTGERICKARGCNLSVFRANQCFYHYWGKYRDWMKRQKKLGKK